MDRLLKCSLAAIIAVCLCGRFAHSANVLQHLLKGVQLDAIPVKDTVLGRLSSANLPEIYASPAHFIALNNYDGSATVNVLINDACESYEDFMLEYLRTIQEPDTAMIWAMWAGSRVYNPSGFPSYPNGYTLRHQKLFMVAQTIIDLIEGIKASGVPVDLSKFVFYTCGMGAHVAARVAEFYDPQTAGGIFAFEPPVKDFDYSNSTNILDKQDFKKVIVFHSHAEYVHQEPFGDVDVYLYDYLTPDVFQMCEREQLGLHLLDFGGSVYQAGMHFPPVYPCQAQGSFVRHTCDHDSPVRMESLLSDTSATGVHFLPFTPFAFNMSIVSHPCKFVYMNVMARTIRIEIYSPTDVNSGLLEGIARVPFRERHRGRYYASNWHYFQSILSTTQPATQPSVAYLYIPMFLDPATMELEIRFRNKAAYTNPFVISAMYVSHLDFIFNRDEVVYKVCGLTLRDRESKILSLTPGTSC